MYIVRADVNESSGGSSLPERDDSLDPEFSLYDKMDQQGLEHDRSRGGNCCPHRAKAGYKRETEEQVEHECGAEDSSTHALLAQHIQHLLAGTDRGTHHQPDNHCDDEAVTGGKLLAEEPEQRLAGNENA